MKIEILTDAQAVAKQAAAKIAEAARNAIAARGRFLLALSGGRTPWIMLRALVHENVAWENVHLFQVDERVAPSGHTDRNLTHIQDCLTSQVPIPREQVHAMPVESADLTAAAASYSKVLDTIAGLPPILDLVHLGLGSDGHTASLVPGDSALNVQDADVAITGVYQGRHRMTLTYPLLNRSRQILWVVTGDEKSEPLERLLRGDRTIPAGCVIQDRSLVLADQAATIRHDAKL